MRKTTGQGMTVKVTPEKILICLVICVLLASCAYSLPTIGSPITKEEAIEISKSASAFREACAVAQYYAVGATYINSSQVELLRQSWQRETLEKALEGHGAWSVEWCFSYNARPVDFAVGVIVDAGTGLIAFDAKGVESY
jgi:hypothetical protein